VAIFLVELRDLSWNHKSVKSRFIIKFTKSLKRVQDDGPCFAQVTHY